MITAKELEDGKKIADLFASLDESDKTMVVGYVSALNDRRVRDEEKKMKLATG